jgi:hypothetical protein
LVVVAEVVVVLPAVDVAAESVLEADGGVVVDVGGVVVASVLSVSFFLPIKQTSCQGT